MKEDRYTLGDGDHRQETLLGEGVSRNGADCAAERRAHMRGLTMARQAAEQRHARPTRLTGLDRTARLAAARERALELRAELDRIDVEHQTWLHNRGEDLEKGKQ
ncbi:MAG: hypothetical protein ACRDIE_02895 [Chloroflexota bacterium]